MNKNVLLHTARLGVGYKKGDVPTFLFNDLELRLYEGELVCFMGPNGVGKSTLLRTLAGLQPELSGSIQYASPGTVASQLAIVLTDRINSLNMTVDEVITFGRYPYLSWLANLSSADRDIIDRSIQATRIEHLLGKKIYELSDGQMQLVMIARAIAQDTPVILLDEPTAHLDLNNRVEMMNLLRRLTRETQKSILLATHELDLALQTADLIWLAAQGGHMHAGFPEDLVLNGVFDEVFQFKGFDLRTGKVTQDVTKNLTIQIQGSGHEYLWTKNALERCGFMVDNASKALVTVANEKGMLTWFFGNHRVSSIKDLIDILEQTS